MANELALVTADKLEVVSSGEQVTAPTLEAITAGAPCRFDPTLGTIRNGNGSDMTEGKCWGLAVATKALGMPLTIIHEGIVDGFDLSGLNYGATVYLSDTDARISGTAGTKAVTVGYVVPGFSEVLGDPPKKLLYVDFSLSLQIS